MVRLAAPAGEELAGMNGGILRALPIPSAIGMQDGHAQVLSEAAASNRKKSPSRCVKTTWGFFYGNNTRRKARCLPPEGDLKHSAVLRGAGHGNFPAQLFRHLLCDGKTEPEAAGFASPALVAAVKAVKHMGEVIRRNGAAGHSAGQRQSRRRRSGGGRVQPRALPLRPRLCPGHHGDLPRHNRRVLLRHGLLRHGGGGGGESCTLTSGETQTESTAQTGTVTIGMGGMGGMNRPSMNNTKADKSPPS